jgi:hypothetical protein
VLSLPESCLRKLPIESFVTDKRSLECTLTEFLTALLFTAYAASTGLVLM